MHNKVDAWCLPVQAFFVSRFGNHCESDGNTLGLMLMSAYDRVFSSRTMYMFTHRDRENETLHYIHFMLLFLLTMLSCSYFLQATAASAAAMLHSNAFLCNCICKCILCVMCIFRRNQKQCESTNVYTVHTMHVDLRECGQF